MTTFSREKPLMTSKIGDPLATHVVCRGNIWHIRVEVAREDSIWIGTAVAYCEIGSVPVLRTLRYGATAEDAQSAALGTLQDAIYAAQVRSNEEKELQ